MSKQSAIASAPIDDPLPWGKSSQPPVIPTSTSSSPRGPPPEPPFGRSRLPRAREKARDPPFDWVFDPASFGLASDPKAIEKDGKGSEQASVNNPSDPTAPNENLSPRVPSAPQSPSPVTPEDSSSGTKFPKESPDETSSKAKETSGEGSKSPGASEAKTNLTSVPGPSVPGPSPQVARLASSRIPFFASSNIGGKKFLAAASAKATIPIPPTVLTTPNPDSTSRTENGSDTSVPTTDPSTPTLTSPNPSSSGVNVMGAEATKSPTGSTAAASDSVASPAASVASSSASTLDPGVTLELLELFESNDRKLQSLIQKERQLAQICGSAVKMLQAEERDGTVLSNTIQRVRQTRKYLLQRIQNPRWEVPHHYHTTALEHSLGRRQPNVMEVGEMITGHLALYALARSTTLSQKMLIFALNKAKKKRAELTEPVRETYRQLCATREEIKQVRLVLDEVTSKVQKLSADINNPNYIKLKDLVKRYMASNAPGAAAANRGADLRQRYLQTLQVPVSYPAITAAVSSSSSTESSAATESAGTTSSIVGELTTSTPSPSQGSDQQLNRVKELLKSLESEVAEFMRAESEREQQRSRDSAAQEAMFYSTEYWGRTPEVPEAEIGVAEATEGETEPVMGTVLASPQLGSGVDDEYDDEARLLKEGAPVPTLSQLVPDGREFGIEIEPTKELPVVVDGLGSSGADEASKRAEPVTSAADSKSIDETKASASAPESTTISSSTTTTAAAAATTPTTTDLADDQTPTSTRPGRSLSASGPLQPPHGAFLFNRFRMNQIRPTPASHHAQSTGSGSSPERPTLALSRSSSGGQSSSRSLLFAMNKQAVGQFQPPTEPISGAAATPHAIAGRITEPNSPSTSDDDEEDADDAKRDSKTSPTNESK